jgi:flavodoxin
MKACVIFDTRYGNTEKIARSLEAGLKSAQVETTCMNEKDVTAGSLTQYDLICVGGPTHYGSASESIRNFLQSLEGTDLSGKMTFAFDTRRDSAFAGSAARFIEGRLRRLGSKVVIHRESAIIQGSDPPSRRESETKDEWKERRHRSETLKDGEEKRFQQIGASIGTTFSAKGRSLD